MGLHLIIRTISRIQSHLPNKQHRELLSKAGIDWRLLRREQGGAPYLESSECAISFSDSGRFEILAVSTSGPVGVDIEDLTPKRVRLFKKPRFIGTLGRLYAKSSLSYRLPKSPETFLEAWTALESEKKFFAVGLATPTSHFLKPRVQHLWLEQSVISIASLSSLDDYDLLVTTL